MAKVNEVKKKQKSIYMFHKICNYRLFYQEKLAKPVGPIGL